MNRKEKTVFYNYLHDSHSSDLQIPQHTHFTSLSLPKKTPEVFSQSGCRRCCSRTVLCWDSSPMWRTEECLVVFRCNHRPQALLVYHSDGGRGPRLSETPLFCSVGAQRSPLRWSPCRCRLTAGLYAAERKWWLTCNTTEKENISNTSTIISEFPMCWFICGSHFAQLAHNEICLGTQNIFEPHNKGTQL